MKTLWAPWVADWVAENIPNCVRGFGDCASMGVFKGEDLVAGVVFHNWQPEEGTIEVSAASSNRAWATRDVMTEVFGYAFGVCQCQMVIAQQSIDNTPARRLWLAIGGTEYVIPRLRGRFEDGSIITLTDDQWRHSKFKR